MPAQGAATSGGFHYPHHTGSLKGRQHGCGETGSVLRRHAECFLPQVVHMCDAVGVGIDEADHSAVLADPDHLERTHGAPGPKPVAERLKAARPLVVRIAALSVAAGLEWLGNFVVDVQPAGDPVGVQPRS